MDVRLKEDAARGGAIAACGGDVVQLAMVDLCQRMVGEATAFDVPTIVEPDGMMVAFARYHERVALEVAIEPFAGDEIVKAHARQVIAAGKWQTGDIQAHSVPSPALVRRRGRGEARPDWAALPAGTD